MSNKKKLEKLNFFKKKKILFLLLFWKYLVKNEKKKQEKLFLYSSEFNNSLLSKNFKVFWLLMFKKFKLKKKLVDFKIIFVLKKKLTIISK